MRLRLRLRMSKSQLSPRMLCSAAQAHVIAPCTLLAKAYPLRLFASGECKEPDPHSQHDQHYPSLIRDALADRD